MSPILQTRLPLLPWADPRTARLPGMLPVEGDDWLRRDEAFAAQMAERDRLIATIPDKVHALTETARPAAEELFDLILPLLAERPGYKVAPQRLTRPDGVCVPLNREAPLLTLGRLLQEDLCILQPGGLGEHVLTAAILCFPASWTLAEKLGHPMSRIHRPVPEYDANITRRVQRLCDAIRPEQPLWRMNHNPAEDPALFHPRSETTPHKPRKTDAPYLRAERQCLLKLPRTGALIFTIHTYMIELSSLPTPDRAAFQAAHIPQP
jgi:dimethylamine monooxygenase subunit A